MDNSNASSTTATTTSATSGPFRDEVEDVMVHHDVEQPLPQLQQQNTPVTLNNNNMNDNNNVPSSNHHHQNDDDQDDDDDVTVILLDPTQGGSTRQRQQSSTVNTNNNHNAAILAWIDQATNSPLDNPDDNNPEWQERRRQILVHELRRLQRASFRHFVLLCLIPTLLLLVVIATVLSDETDCVSSAATTCELEPRTFINAFTTRCVCDAIGLVGTSVP
ncbi:hypothetical protein ACA910_022556 [Epithemia clementina (nom. ined.)]